MANSKLFFASMAPAGASYCIVKRLTDGYYLDDAAGAFGAAPADPYVSLVEDSVARGLYALSESRTTWLDGTYRVVYYLRSGGAPSPVADSVVKTEDVALSGDRLVTTEVTHGFSVYLRQGVMGILRHVQEILGTLNEMAKGLRINNANTSTIDRAQKRI